MLYYLNIHADNPKSFFLTLLCYRWCLLRLLLPSPPSWQSSASRTMLIAFSGHCQIKPCFQSLSLVSLFRMTSIALYIARMQSTCLNARMLSCFLFLSLCHDSDLSSFYFWFTFTPLCFSSASCSWYDWRKTQKMLPYHSLKPLLLSLIHFLTFAVVLFEIGLVCIAPDVLELSL